MSAARSMVVSSYEIRQSWTYFEGCRELAGLALGGSMQSPWGSPIRYDTNINLAPATPTDPSCSCSGPGARRALF